MERGVDRQPCSQPAAKKRRRKRENENSKEAAPTQQTLPKPLPTPLRASSRRNMCVVPPTETPPVGVAWLLTRNTNVKRPATQFLSVPRSVAAALPTEWTLCLSGQLHDRVTSAALPPAQKEQPPCSTHQSLFLRSGP